MLGKGQTKQRKGDSEIGSMCTERDILMGKKNTVGRNTGENIVYFILGAP